MDQPEGDGSVLTVSAESIRGLVALGVAPGALRWPAGNSPVNESG
jgi:hypothetical protein